MELIWNNFGINLGLISNNASLSLGLLFGPCAEMMAAKVGHGEGKVWHPSREGEGHPTRACRASLAEMVFFKRELKYHQNLRIRGNCFFL